MSGENYHLIIRKGPQPGQIYPLLAPDITIGRDPMSDIVLNDPEVSRYHAQLTQTDAGYQIQDMGSTNGTFVAGQRLSSETVTLVPGQEVAFGSGITLTYEQTGGDDDPAMATFVEPSREPVDSVPETAVPEMNDPPPLDSYAPDPPPPSYAPDPATPLVPPADGEAARKKKRNTIILAVALVLLCCCCIFPLSGWFIWGDPLLDLLIQQGILPSF
ncbi:MAG: FHA domain-containing protein [Chloroflexi bacterium]|nr:FHA domain-containing protein [Chloroflexota bacterium]